MPELCTRLTLMATALPNLAEDGGHSGVCRERVSIFLRRLADARHATATLGYCILAFLISYFFLKSREIAA